MPPGKKHIVLHSVGPFGGAAASLPPPRRPAGAPPPKKKVAVDVEASETPADAPPTKKKVVLVVDVPPSIPDGDDAVAKEFVTEKQANPAVLKNSKSFVAPRLYRDEDVHEAGRRGWISGPCDCIVSIGATLGDAIEGGADQIVGLALLMISGAIAFVASGGFASLWTKWFDGDAVEGSNQGASAAPPPPSVLHHAVHSSSVYAQAHPSAFVALLLGGLVTIGLLVIFEEDLHRSLNALRLRWAGYQPLEKPQTPAPPGASQGVRWASSAVHHAASTDDTEPDAAPDAAPERRLRVMRERTLKHELQRAVDLTEDLELQALLAGRQVGVAERHQEQQARVGALRQALTHQAPELAISPELRKASVKWREDERSCGARCMQSSFVNAAKRSLNGLVVIWLYFADVISDIEVAALLYESGMLVYACIAGGLLVLQFLVVYLRVLPYLHATFGRASCPYQLFLWLGFPFGMLGLDLFMFLEPFGLLRTLPLPDSLRQFVPAYKATRIIAEVMIESLPQCLLQSYILVTVMRHVRLQHESASEHELMMASMNGIAFAELLPRSITISVVTMLKTWIELVYSAREAGISVRVKAAQLWHVGHGLPLDALKKGALFEWSCTYILSDGEVPPLMDALIKNASLTRLNLAMAGLEWDSSEARMERSGAALIEAMATSPAACSELQALIVGPSGFEVPIGRLRKGGASALAALRDMAMLSPGGPWRLEIQLMADLLRKPRGTSAATTAAAAADAKGAVAGVVAKFIDAAARGDIRREQWEETLTQLMVAGEARRAHVKALLTARVLRLVGMRAKTLLAADFCEEELFVGGFEAAELLALGCTHARLYELGYTPRGLKSAGLSASELRNLGCSALSLKRANYAAEALLLARYPLTELRQAAYSPAELLRAGGCTVAQLRAVGVEASELKVCLKPEPKMELIPQAHLNPQAQLLDRAAVVDALRAKASAADAGAAQLLTIANLREGGYSAIELKGAGFDCKQVFKAGYDATEATKAQYSLAQLVGAGYRPPELRRAGHEARGLREVGISLDELRRAEYSPAELQQAGFEALELKQAGTSLLELRKANTPVPTLRAAGYTAVQLRQHGYTAKELAGGGYTAKELRGFRDSLAKEAKDAIYAGYSAMELREGSVPYSGAELKEAGYSAAELRAGGWTPLELRAKGFGCAELLACGFTAKEMYNKGAFALLELREVTGVPGIAASLRAGGVSASEMRRVGFDADQLFRGGYDAAEMYAVGYTRAELKACGFEPKQLASTGCTLGELLEQLGFTVDELRRGGYTIKQLHECEDDAMLRFTQDDGLSDEQLLAAGFPQREVGALNKSAAALRAAGYSAAELQRIGFALRELRTAGFPWKEAGFAFNATYDELVAAGFQGVNKNDPVFMSA